MNLFFKLICFFLLLSSCNNRESHTLSTIDSINKISQGEFCNGGVGFYDSSFTTHIAIDIDTVGNLKSMSEYFECLEKNINKNIALKNRFIRNSENFYISFSSYANIKMTDVNYELINYADTSVFWTGKPGHKSSREAFFKFIVNSGYANKWEQVLSEILGKKYRWKYGAENIFYITGSELSAMQPKKYKKEIYPISFELYITRE